MYIKQHLTLSNLVSHTSDMNDLLKEKAQIHVNSWGEPEVTVSGYEGSISLDKLAKRVVDAVSYWKPKGLARIDRAIVGLEILRNVKNFYNSDCGVKNKNYFTIFLHSMHRSFPTTSQKRVDYYEKKFSVLLKQLILNMNQLKEIYLAREQKGVVA